jgi:hypothetical protein
MLAFHASMRLHNIIHVSLLNKCVLDPNYIIDWIVIQVEHEGVFRVELEGILDQKVKFVRNKSMGLVKVHWTCYNPEDATWEHEETIGGIPIICCQF